MWSCLWTVLPVLPALVHAAPRVTLRNGTYEGVHDASFNQDYFLGIPYATPPLGSLRYRNPVELDARWNGTRDAKAYSLSCIGYGYPGPEEQSEDCLTINVIRPAGVTPRVKLPVAVWIYGGGYFTGSSSWPHYNFSDFVRISQKYNTPLIAVSFNYRMAQLGFLASKEVIDQGVANLGMKDQRLALRWIQDNIAAFGGDPRKVTIWGESAGGFSVGQHMLGWNGSSEGLFRSAICQSGGPFLDGTYRSLKYFEPQYKRYLDATGCSSASDHLECLRALPLATIQKVVEDLGQQQVWAMPVIDNVVMHELPSRRLKKGRFAKVPLLTGTTSDEASQYMLDLGINTEKAFRDFVRTPDNVEVYLSNKTIDRLARAYPDDPKHQIPASLEIALPAAPPLYDQFKRVATYHSDRTQIAPRRWTCQTWAARGLPVYCYRFDTKPLTTPVYNGVAHFDDIPYVFGNTAGRGYEVNPFAGAPKRYFELAEEMPRRWIAFIASGNPNVKGLPAWSTYGALQHSLVFEGNVTKSWVERDIFRKKGMDALYSVVDELLI